MKYKKKLGLALGSGGPKGFVHVGVIKELVLNKIPIDFIAGTSIGAWVGAHYSLFQDVGLLEEYTLGKRKEKAWALFDPTFKGGFVKGEKVAKFLKEWLNDSKFKDTKIPFRVVATDILSGKPKVFSRGEIVPAVQGSMAIPALFKPVQIGKKYYVDGGLSNPVPDDVVHEMGADIVLSVNLDNCLNKKIFTVKNLTSMTAISRRSFDIIRHYLADYTLQDSDFVIRPAVPYFEPTLWKRYFTGKVGEDLVKLGQREARKIIPELKRALK